MSRCQPVIAGDILYSGGAVPVMGLWGKVAPLIGSTIRKGPPNGHYTCVSAINRIIPISFAGPVVTATTVDPTSVRRQRLRSIVVPA